MFLDGLDLLGHRGQCSLLQSVELVKTSPGSHLAETNKDPSHGLEVKGLVAVEDEDEPPQLITQSLHSLRLAGTSGTKRRTTQPGLQGLCHGEITPAEMS